MASESPRWTWTCSLKVRYFIYKGTSHTKIRPSHVKAYKRSVGAVASFSYVWRHRHPSLHRVDRESTDSLIIYHHTSVHYYYLSQHRVTLTLYYCVPKCTLHVHYIHHEPSLFSTLLCAHVGQFWNIPINVAIYNGPATDSDAGQRYIIQVEHPESEPRVFTGLLAGYSWEEDDNNCFYVGNRQGGTIREVDDPNDSVIEGTYRDYQTGGDFNTAFKFSHFDDNRCL